MNKAEMILRLHELFAPMVAECVTEDDHYVHLVDTLSIVVPDRLINRFVSTILCYVIEKCVQQRDPALGDFALSGALDPLVHRLSEVLTTALESIVKSIVVTDTTITCRIGDEVIELPYTRHPSDTPTTIDIAPHDLK